MKKILILCCLLISGIPAWAKPIELVFWHGMAGHLGDEVRLLVDDFNHSQNEYVIRAVYKGNYIETLTSFAAAFRAHQPPAIVQIYEVGTAMMLNPTGVIKPVDVLLKEQGVQLPQADFIQSVKNFYSRDGQLMGMPFNLSAPVLYYNRDVLKKVGYDTNNFPKTWAEMEALAVAIQKAGYECAYTTAYPGWILFESFLAIHGLAITQNQPVHAVFNTPELAHHFSRLKRWHEKGYFHYGGRIDDATVLFTSGVCPLFSQSSGSYNSLSGLVDFNLGIAALPLDTEVSKVRHANVAGGAALWAVGGQSQAQYRGIAQFFAFIAKPEVQKRWHAHTGYLPLGLTGVYADIVKTSQHPALQIAKTDLEEHSGNLSIHNVGPENQIRTINDEVLEAMFAGLVSSKQALNDATARADHVLFRFAKNTER